MTKRLTVQDWIDFALRTLARDGFEALKADVLARKLGVSRGSFYWHFGDIDDFHRQVIAHWREAATEAIIADLEPYGAREERLDELLRRAFGGHSVVEIRMRAWADTHAEAARAVREMDRRRREYIERLLEEIGVPRPQAVMRAQVLYWAYLGAALERSKLAGDALDALVGELRQIAVGARAPSGTVLRGRLSRRQRA